jgi:hypothetical protein
LIYFWRILYNTRQASAELKPSPNPHKNFGAIGHEQSFITYYGIFRVMSATSFGVKHKNYGELKTAAGWVVKDDGSGNIAFFLPNGTEHIGINSGGALFDETGLLVINTALGINVGIQNFKGRSTVGFEIPAIIGLDNRTGLTTADASATTLYTTTAAGQAYEISARILATAGSSATYKVSWTEGGRYAVGLAYRKRS